MGSHRRTEEDHSTARVRKAIADADRTTVEHFDRVCRESHRILMGQREALTHATQRRLTLAGDGYHFTDEGVLVQAGTGRPVASLGEFPALLRMRNYLQTLQRRVAAA